MAGLSAYTQRSFNPVLRFSTSTPFHTLTLQLKALTALDTASTPEWEVDSHQTSELKDVHGGIAPACADPGILRAWKVLRKGEHCLDNNLISKHTWAVLNVLRDKGHDAYLVGGSVRDMLLRKIPKDFDVLTTAEPKQVKQGFAKSMIVGRRFPVCHVNIYDKIIEVSSFSTSAKGMNHKRGHDPKELKLANSDGSSHSARWKNSLKRDFTINGLMYDPFESTLYDYVGGIEDLKKRKLRTVIPAFESFQEDVARLLRAIRIAARLGFRFSRDTARAIQHYALSILDLNKSRLMMEVNYMFSYGAAEISVRMLWRFGILEILLPLQAAYLASQGFKRRDETSNMLLDLLANLDKVVSPDRPCHCSLWMNLFALHLALVNNPQCSVVVSALALAMYSEKGIRRAVVKAGRIHYKHGSHGNFFPETDAIQDLKSSCKIIEEKVLQMQEDAVKALHCMNDRHYIANAMLTYPQAPRSDVVLLSKPVLEKCICLFNRVKDDIKQNNHNRRDRKPADPINFKALVKGEADELSYVFSRVVLNTLYPHAAKKK